MFASGPAFVGSGMYRPTPRAVGLGSRALILGLLVAAAVIALVPGVVARTRRVQTMRAELAEVLDQCRARYAAAESVADTIAADSWQPAFHGERRPADPACGPYRRRNMLEAPAR